MAVDVLAASDLDGAREILSAAYGRMRLAAGEGPSQGVRLASTRLGDLCFGRLTLRMTLTAHADPHDAFTFGLVRSGRVRIVSAGRERDYRPGEMFLAAQPDHPHVAGIDDAAADTVMLPPALLAAVTDGPVRFTGYRAVTADAAALWTATCGFLLSSTRAATEAAPLVAGAAGRLLMSTALTVFPNTAVLEPTGADRVDAHSRTLRHAISYIEGHADRDIGVADIAAACAVSTRAVQLAFRRQLDTTPLAYLRRVRLGHARDELRAGQPGATTVAAVAARWGFLNAGQFAGHYRAAFGELPSRTLGR